MFISASYSLTYKKTVFVLLNACEFEKNIYKTEKFEKSVKEQKRKFKKTTTTKFRNVTPQKEESTSHNHITISTQPLSFRCELGCKFKQQNIFFRENLEKSKFCL